ncbi:MAG: DUF3857 domain-containing protein [Cyclobacteriaceae bacterium]
MRFLIVALLLISLSSSAQKAPIKFGDIPMADMKMTVYDKDSSANAVVLTDYGIAYITVTSGGAVLNFERHTRIKILKKEGLDLANSSILLYHSGSAEEKMTGLKASSYNLEGGKIVETKLSKEGIFKEKYNRNYNQQKFTLPNVKEGSVIEYTYKKTSEFFTNFPNWQFQRSIPVRWSEYWAMIPSIFIYEKYMQGYVPVSSYENKNQSYYDTEVKAHHWITENVPAFKDEPFMTCEDDYISKLNFALSHINYSTHSEEIMGSWQKLNDNLLENDDFGKVIAKSGFLKDQVEQLTTGITEPLKKIEVISSHIKQTIEWDGEEDFYAGNFKKIIEKKSGTSGDINLMLASMLDKAGLQVDMVMLSTRDHGFVRQAYPMTKQFNYVICSVNLDGKTILLDATEKYLPFDILPSRCMNGQGLVISKKNHGWVTISTKAKAKTIVSADLALAADGELKGKIQYTRDGYDAEAMRESYNKKGEATYVKDFLASKQWQVEKSAFQDVKDLSKSVKESHEVSISEHSSAAGDVIYINPFVTSQEQENPFKSEKREYPVDFGSLTDKTYMCKITLPENFVIDELPKSKVIALPANAGKYMYNAVQTGNIVSITSAFQINKSLFIQDEYPLIKEFYNQVVAKQAEQIVVKKK